MGERGQVAGARLHVCVLLRVVLSNRPDRIARYSHLWSADRIVWAFAPTVREAHLWLARLAVSEGWDETVRVSQDDVTVEEWPEHQGEVTSYYSGRWWWHTCPRAFTATREGWGMLAEKWAIPGKTCELWMPDFRYDVTVSLED